MNTTITNASEFVADYHRHHDPPQGGLWAVSVVQLRRTVGVAIVGRPVARGLQDRTNPTGYVLARRVPAAKPARKAARPALSIVR